MIFLNGAHLAITEPAMDKEDVKITAAGKAGGNSTAKQPRKRIKGLLKKLQDQVKLSRHRDYRTNKPPQ